MDATVEILFPIQHNKNYYMVVLIVLLDSYHIISELSHIHIYRYIRHRHSHRLG